MGPMRPNSGCPDVSLETAWKRPSEGRLPLVAGEGLRTARSSQGRAGRRGEANP